jgi:hypothetical protein
MPFLTCKAGIVTRIRRRTVRERRGLAGRERWYLRYGDFTAGDEEDPDSFIYRDENGQWTVDKAAAGKVWEDPDRCRRADGHESPGRAEAAPAARDRARQSSRLPGRHAPPESRLRTGGPHEQTAAARAARWWNTP